MSKKILAVLLAICMIASGCVLFASAVPTGTAKENLAKGDWVTADGYKVHTVSITKKANPTVGNNDTAVTDANIDELVDIKLDGTAVEYADISQYIKLKSGCSIDFESGTATIVFEKDATNNPSGTTWYVKATTVAEGAALDASVVESVGKAEDGTVPKNQNRYNLANTTVTVNKIKRVIKLCTLTTGVHFYGENTNNLVASEIAIVEASVSRSGGIVKQTVSTSAYNVIHDLLPGDKVTLTTKLKDKKDEKFYSFNCWVNGSNELLETKNSIEITITGGNETAYANYVEIVGRHTISYSSNGDGTMVVFPDGVKNTVKRSVFEGDEQISVLHGKPFTFSFVPADGYEVGKVIITDSLGNKKDAASFLTFFGGLISNGNVKELWQTLVNATGVDRDLFSSEDVAQGTYTFKSVEEDYSIYVEFVKKNPLEAPSGMELPTIETPERDELSTGAADGAEGAEGGANSATTLPAENGAAANGSAIGGVVNPATGSGSAIAVFAVLTLAAGAAFVTMKKKED